jgi:hypothetical protein
MKSRDKRRRRTKELRRGNAPSPQSSPPGGEGVSLDTMDQSNGQQKTNGKRTCKWDQRLLDISVCIVRQHRSSRTCFGCQWLRKQ